MTLRLFVISRERLYITVALACLVIGLTVGAAYKYWSEPYMEDDGEIRYQPMMAQTESMKSADPEVSRSVNTIGNSNDNKADGKKDGLQNNIDSNAKTTEGQNLNAVDSGQKDHTLPDQQNEFDNLTTARIQYNYDNTTLAAQRLSRDYVRSQEIDLLNQTVNRKDADPELVKEAEGKLLNLIDIMEKEVNAEGLIKSHGYGDALVYISDGSIDATVAGDKLSKEDAAVIGDVLVRATGAKLHEIRIRRSI